METLGWRPPEGESIWVHFRKISKQSSKMHRNKDKRGYNRNRIGLSTMQGRKPGVAGLGVASGRVQAIRPGR